MKFLNCSLPEFKKKVQKKRVILFGAGKALQSWGAKALADAGIKEQIPYIVDNADHIREFLFDDRMIPVKKPKELRKEKNAAVLIVNQNYADEICEQLDAMNLDESLEVYDLYFIMAVSCGRRMIPGKKEDQTDIIPKVIHTFWFSGEPVPKAYQHCVDTWNRHCEDYTIKVWTSKEYDCCKIPFTRAAYEAKKWAFVADYARVDVLCRYGGVYMDMDVEVLRNFDELLHLQGFFSFDMNHDVGLEVFGSVPNNPLLQDIKEEYETGTFDITDLVGITQPKMIRNTMRKFGVTLNGDSQMVHGNWIASRNYFNPQDYVIYETGIMDEKTFTIHRSNMGWHDRDKKNEQVMKNKSLFLKFEEGK